MAKQREGIKTLTVEMKEAVYAEFRAAIAVFRKKHMSDFVHDWILMQIDNAKNRVSPDEFAGFVRDAQKEIDARSRSKKKERLNGQGLAPTSSKGMRTPKKKEKAADEKAA